MRKRRSRYYFDAVTLSNFALVSRLDLLKGRYGRQLYITGEVLDELTAGAVSGYPRLNGVEKAVHRGEFTLDESLRSPKERTLYGSMLRHLSSGEASCITCAIIRGGIVVTDDRAARDCCTEHRILFTGTIGILKACCMDRTITTADADLILQNMIQEGYHSPVRRISDII
jgi:predicted nucleic acid-binding protein